MLLDGGSRKSVALHVATHNNVPGRQSRPSTSAQGVRVAITRRMVETECSQLGDIPTAGTAGYELALIAARITGRLVRRIYR